jgi:hypothetical protein
VDISVASWFETRGVAALLTMRIKDLTLLQDLIAPRPHPEEARSAVSKDAAPEREATPAYPPNTKNPAVSSRVPVR